MSQKKKTAKNPKKKVLAVAHVADPKGSIIVRSIDEEIPVPDENPVRLRPVWDRELGTVIMVPVEDKE